MDQGDRGTQRGMDQGSSQGFGGRAVVTFESRRAAEMASLITRHGGAPISAPALREVTNEQEGAVLDFVRAMDAGGFDVVVLMTGVGTRAMTSPAFVAALSRVPHVVARGPKPAAVLRERGIGTFSLVPPPNTWREVLGVIRERAPLAGLRVAVQEHGAPSVELYEALRGDGAVVTPVPVYKWALPEDTGPLRAALRSIAAGEAQVALFTSRAQVEHAISVAAEEGIADAVVEALRRGVVGSIGPVCTEALRAEGIAPDVEPEHPKMGHLAKAAAERAAAILAEKAQAARAGGRDGTER